MRFQYGRVLSIYSSSVVRMVVYVKYLYLYLVNSLVLKIKPKNEKMLITKIINTDHCITFCFFHLNHDDDYIILFLLNVLILEGVLYII